MVITRQDETELLTTLHEGVLEDPLWTTFLSRLRGRLRADEARILIARPAAPDLPTQEFVATRRRLDRDPRQRLTNSYRQNPTLFQHLRPNRVYADDELSVVTSTSPPAEAVHVERRRLMRVPGSDGVSAWLDISRHGPAFDAGDGALLAALAPHLAIAMRMLASLRKANARVRVASGGLARIGIGWLMLDTSGHVVDSDEQADRVLQGYSSSWRAGDGQVRLPGPIVNFIASAQDRARAVRFAGEPPIDLLLRPLADSLTVIATGATTIAYVGGVAWRACPDVGAITALFQLPPAEGRLATRLAAGDSIAEAADALNLTIETARNYSKRIYARAGLRGQSDLVRAILGSVAALS